jgi:hypothetical protein
MSQSTTDDCWRPYSWLQSRRETAKLKLKSSPTDDEGFSHLRGSNTLRQQLRLGALVVLTLLVAIWRPAGVQAGPTPEEYVAHVGGDAELVPAGKLKIDGRKLVCGRLWGGLSGLPDPQQEAAGPGFHTRQAVDPRARMRAPVPWPGRGAGGLLRRAAWAGREMADARGSRGGVPLHRPRQGRQHAFLRLAPLRRHAPMLRRSDPQVSNGLAGSRLRVKGLPEG